MLYPKAGRSYMNEEGLWVLRDALRPRRSRVGFFFRFFFSLFRMMR